MQLNLKCLRKARLLTQKQLAELCNTSTQKISRLEQDRFEYLERDLIDALCAVLYCKIGDLIKVKRLQSMRNWQIRFYLKWSDFKCCVTYPYYMFALWWMVVTKDPYLETVGESRQYFWDSLSFNEMF